MLGASITPTKASTKKDEFNNSESEADRLGYGKSPDNGSSHFHTVMWNETPACGIRSPINAWQITDSFAL